MMKVAEAVAAAIMIVLGGGAAAQTLVGTPSDATGFDDLVVDGQSYDVTFAAGPFNQVFSAGLTFTNRAVAFDAAQKPVQRVYSVLRHGF